MNFCWYLIFYCKLELLSLTMTLYPSVMYEYIILTNSTNSAWWDLCISLRILFKREDQLLCRIASALYFCSPSKPSITFFAKSTFLFWDTFFCGVESLFFYHVIAILYATMCSYMGSLHLDKTLARTFLNVLFEICQMIHLVLSALIIQQSSIHTLVTTPLKPFMVGCCLLVLS